MPIHASLIPAYQPRLEPFMRALAILFLLVAPAACASAPPAANTVAFKCADGSDLTAAFSEGSVTVTSRDGTFTLPQQVMGSGIRYSDGMRTFVGKGKEMRWEFARRAPLVCITP